VQPETEATSLPSIGFATESKVIGEDIHINILGAFNCRLQAGVTDSVINQAVNKSLAVGGDGFVNKLGTTASRGITGVCMEVATAGNVFLAMPIVTDVN
jgi:hypothetical protein